MKKTLYIGIGFALGFLFAGFLAIKIPIRNEVTITHTEIKTVSVILEKKKCEAAGGLFVMNGGYSWPSMHGQGIECIAATPPDIFDYEFN